MKLRKCCRAAWKEPQRNFSSFFVICAVRLSSTPLRLSLGEPSILSEGCAKRQAFPALSVNRLPRVCLLDLSDQRRQAEWTSDLAAIFVRDDFCNCTGSNLSGSVLIFEPHTARVCSNELEVRGHIPGAVS